MGETFLYQNASKSITVLDLPCSIQHGQCLSASLMSVAARRVPYPSTEPKGRTREKLVNDIPKAEREYHDGICALLSSALHEARIFIGNADWCYVRKEQCMPDETPELRVDGSEGQPPSSHPPLFLSPDFENCVPTMADLEGSFILNPLPASAILVAEARSFVIPPQSTFLCTTIRNGIHLFNDITTPKLITTGSGAVKSCFDFILLDPPWANRSVRNARTRTYRTAETQDDPFDEVLPALHSHVTQNGIIAVWITNKAAIRYHVLQALSDHGGFELFEEWIWLKVTQKGDPVTSIDGLWRKPYEVLLLFTRSPSPVSVPQRRVMIAVPDFHSRKPCLKRLIEPLLPQPYRALEVFARSLTAGWWSWGDECLKYQHTTDWDF
jgi:N6-adenosine-specific RNA methylase IME4